MIAVLNLNDASGRRQVESLLRRLRLNPLQAVLDQGSLVEQSKSVRLIMADVAQRGDAALVDSARQFDDPNFTAAQLKVTPQEMAAAAGRLPADELAALRRSIAQVRAYQTHILPHDPAPLRRGGAEFGLRFTPLDSAGLLVPGGKAAYPSSVIMLAVPALVAGVKRVVVCTPASRYGQSDIVLAAYHELGLSEVYRAGGASAVAALAIGTQTIRPVDKLVGPGNIYMQLAKQAMAGYVGIDGYLGPSEILTLADDSANAEFIAADLLAQAEHDPGSCFLLTDSQPLADAVVAAMQQQLASLSRRPAIEKALAGQSAIIIGAKMDELIDLANQFAAEHLSLQVRDEAHILPRLKHAGAIFRGPWSPVAAGDYIAGPSHCLPTNTTSRFASGVSVYEFLKRTSLVRYDAPSLAADAPAITALANAEHLDAHAASVKVRKNS